jgi:DNA-binding response OmpR family regulator
MSGNRMHIAVVDDERDIRETVAEYLTLHGFRVTPVAGGEELRRLLEASRIDLVVLDISMPGEDGLSLARFLRVQHTAGIIMLTASGETVDRIVGLETGADDYLAKPVDLRELLARIKAVLRRAGRDPHDPRAAETGPANRIVRFGRCSLDLDAHKLLDEVGGEVAMTAMEFDLLKAFAEHPNRVLSRDMLLDLAHNRDWEPFDRSIDIRIARLRRKIEKDPSKPETLRTVRGAGYMFVGEA